MCFFFLMIRRPPRSTLDRSSAASDVYKRQAKITAGGYDGENAAWNQDSGDSLPLAGAGGVHGNRGGGRAEVVASRPSGSCLLYTSPSPRDRTRSRMPSSA